MDFKISAEKREKNEKLNKDIIPAVIYGHGIDSQSLKLSKVKFEKVFGEAGESNLIVLNLGGEEVKVLVKDIQRDVLSHSITHVDFYKVNMKEKVVTEIPLHYVGESKAVKELGGMLNKDLDAVEVECLPGDLVDHIDVDISVLTTFDDAIRIADLKLPANVVATANPEEMVASVKEPKVVVEEPVVASDEVKEGEEKKEGENKEEEKKD